MTLLGPRMLPLLIVLAALLGPGAPATARADAAGASRVALVQSSRLWAPGGIASYAAARARLDAERPKFTVAEHPGGTPPPAPKLDLSQLPAEVRKKIERELEEEHRESIRNEAWRVREANVLDPIRADVMRALDRYARARGIGLVLDRRELGAAVLAAAPGVDITDAFIKDYNAGAAKGPARPPAK